MRAGHGHKQQRNRQQDVLEYLHHAHSDQIAIGLFKKKTARLSLDGF